MASAFKYVTLPQLCARGEFRDFSGIGVDRDRAEALPQPRPSSVDAAGATNIDEQELLRRRDLGDVVEQRAGIDHAVQAVFSPASAADWLAQWSRIPRT